MNRRSLALLIAALALLAGVALTGRIPRQGAHFGVWSLLPPLVAIALAFITREVISALVVGVLLGGVISGQANVVQHFILPAVGSPAYGLILLVYLWSLGGLIGLWTRTGGALTFAEWAAHLLVRGPRSAKLFAWLMGLVFHQGGTISTVLTGVTVRPVCDRHRVSHEELSYIVDSTASPAATLIPFNVWPIYVAGLVAGTVPPIASSADAVAFFFKALPFNFYGWFAVLLALLFALDQIPFMPGRRWARIPLIVGNKMSAAIRRARETGSLDRPGAEPMVKKELAEVRIAEGYRSGLLDFFGPMATLLGVAILPYLYGLLVRGADDPPLRIAEAFTLAVVAAFAIAMIKGMKLREAMGAVIDGCSGVTVGAVILALAVTLKQVTDAVGTAPYIIELTRGVLSPPILPALLLGLCMAIAFSTGTSWGTYAVVFPVALPLAWSVHPDPFFLLLCFGAVTGGSTFGDQCSPISDTTVLSALATGADLMDHVHTQIPMAVTAAGLGALTYTALATWAV